MVLIKDKNINAGAIPPQLPPYLRRRDEPERRVRIVPSILRMEYSSRLQDYKNNWTTIVYYWMDRIEGSIFDPTSWSTTHITTRLYKQWLETYSFDNDIPPHIVFGGAIESGKGDPTFYQRWREYAKETFV